VPRRAEMDTHAVRAGRPAFAARVQEQGHVTSLSSPGFAIFFALDLICFSQAVGKLLLLLPRRKRERTDTHGTAAGVGEGLRVLSATTRSKFVVVLQYTEK
jgi:hypothetical protein